MGNEKTVKADATQDAYSRSLDALAKLTGKDRDTLHAEFTASETPTGSADKQAFPGSPIQAMFNNPDMLSAIASIMDGANNGRTQDEVMSDLLEFTDLTSDQFVSAVAGLSAKADGNPFVEGDSKGKGESKKEKNSNPFSDESGDESEGDEVSDDSEDGSDELGEEHSELGDLKLAKEAVELIEKLIKSEEKESVDGEDESKHIEVLLEALELIKEFMFSESDEVHEEVAEEGGDGVSKDVEEPIMHKDGPMPKKLILTNVEPMAGGVLDANSPDSAKISSKKNGVTRKAGDPEILRDLANTGTDPLDLGKPEPFLGGDAPAFSKGQVVVINPAIANAYASVGKSLDTTEATVKSAYKGPVDWEYTFVEGGIEPLAESMLSPHDPMKGTTPYGNETPAVTPAGNGDCSACGGKGGILPEGAADGAELEQCGVCNGVGGNIGPTASFRKNDRVWRKADALGGMLNTGDELGRVVEIGGGKVIVDWGEADILAEENPSDIVLAKEAGDMSSLFSSVEAVADEPEYDSSDNAGPMGIPEDIEDVLRETSLFDMLKKHAGNYAKGEAEVKHIASGTRGRVVAKLSDGSLRVVVNGKEMTVRSYEVE